MTRDEQFAEKIIDRLLAEKKAALDANNWKKHTFRKIMRDAIVAEIHIKREESKITYAEKCEIIYQLYPRKVAPEDGKRAIEKAIKLKGFEHIRNRTMAYGEAVRKWSRDFRFRGTSGSDLVPHPATWFNRGSYDDDPREWEGDRRYAPTKPQNAPEGPPADWVDRFMRKYSSSDWEALKGAVRRNSDGKVFHWQDLPADLRTELLER